MPTDKNRRHYCYYAEDLYENGKWYWAFEYDLPTIGDSDAIYGVEEYEGKFWAFGGSAFSQVNYCPFCGAKAPIQLDKKFKPNKEYKMSLPLF